MIDTKLFANPVTIRALFDDLHKYKTNTLANAITALTGSLNAENVVRIYYASKLFKSEAVSLLSGLTQQEIDAANQRETGSVTGIYADLIELRTRIDTMTALVEANQATIFATQALGENRPIYGNLTTNQRNAILNAVNNINAMFV